jgi:hypothetical protein
MEIMKLGLMLAKVESVYGTDPTPTPAANSIGVVGNTIAWRPVSERVPRQILDKTLVQVPGWITKKSSEIKFRVELRGNRTNGTAADISAGAIANLIEIDCLLQACDLAATYTAEATGGSRDGYVIYKATYPVDPGVSVTIYWYTALKAHKMIGCKGTAEFSFEAGKPAYIDFTFRGLYVAVADATFSGLSATFLATKPPLLVSSTATYNSYAAIFSKVGLSLGNTVSQRDDVLSAEGIKGFFITDKQPTGTFDPESVAEATYAFWANWAADTVAALSMTLGADAGNKFTLTASVQPVEQGYAERNGGRIHQVQFAIVKASLGATAGAELQLKWG